METSDLDGVARARLAPYEAAAHDPIWIWPVMGALVFAQLASWEIEPVIVPILVMVLYCFGLGALIGVMTRRRGVQPTMDLRKMPSTLRRELIVFWILSGAAAAAVAALAILTNFVVAGAVAGLGLTLLGGWYHRRYRDRVAELVAAL